MAPIFFVNLPLPLSLSVCVSSVCVSEPTPGQTQTGQTRDIRITGRTYLAGLVNAKQLHVLLESRKNTN